MYFKAIFAFETIGSNLVHKKNNADTCVTANGWQWDDTGGKAGHTILHFIVMFQTSFQNCFVLLRGVIALMQKFSSSIL